MRWLVLWLLLTAIQALGWLASRLLPAPGTPWGRAEDLAHLAIVPLVQALALAVVAAVRRRAALPDDGALPPPEE